MDRSKGGIGMEWISVKDKLPEDEKEMVLVTDGDTVITGFRNWMFSMEYK